MQVLHGHLDMASSLIAVGDDYMVSGGDGSDTWVYVWKRTNGVFSLERQLHTGGSVHALLALSADTFVAHPVGINHLQIWNVNGLRRNVHFAGGSEPSGITQKMTLFENHVIMSTLSTSFAVDLVTLRFLRYLAGGMATVCNDSLFTLEYNRVFRYDSSFKFHDFVQTKRMCSDITKLNNDTLLLDSAYTAADGKALIFMVDVEKPVMDDKRKIVVDNTSINEVQSFKHLVVAASYQDVHIHDSNDGSLIQKLSGHTGQVNAVIINDKMLATACSDGTICVWKPEAERIREYCLINS